MSATPGRSQSPWLYWGVLLLIGVLITAGLLGYIEQLKRGLGITGLGRDVTWGLYIAQFTFTEGLAACAVVVLLPSYLHDAREFERIALFGVLLSIAAVTMCLAFILVDLGQPARVFNVLLHPTPSSMMFWDMVSLGGYLLLNVIIALSLLEVRRTGMDPPAWLRGIVLVSIPWGIAVHTVTAFLYSGLPGRSLWFTTILAPRFLASAFATSAALLILVCLSLRRYAAFDAGAPALRRLGTIMTYALFANLFLLLPELFSVLYARVPDSYASLSYLYVGLEGHAPLVPLMWWSVTMSLVALVALLLSWRRRPDAVLAGAALLVLSGVGLDKGFGLIIAGFVPGPLGTIPVYVPTLPEWAVVIGIWGLGALIVTVTYRVALASPVPMVREPLEQT